jgi:hypothetical protein
VILVPGESSQVKIVQEIFLLFVERSLDERQIAGQLNTRGVPYPGGVQWSAATVREILSDEQYAGSVVYNKSTQRLKTKSRRNPPQAWIITPKAYQPIVPPDMYKKAQGIFEKRERRCDPAEMLANLRAVYAKYHVITSRLIRCEKSCPAPSQYANKFGGLTGAFQAMFGDILSSVRDRVLETIRQDVKLVDTYEDFFVINGDFTVLVQPAVPMPDGYGAFWAFRPDHRPVIDITLGVPLSNGGKHEILGYLALPRLMVREPWVRLSSKSEARIEMHGYSGLDLIRELTQ